MPTRDRWPPHDGHDATIVLTGATTGIGRATALTLAPGAGHLILHGLEREDDVADLLRAVRAAMRPGTRLSYPYPGETGARPHPRLEALRPRRNLPDPVDAPPVAQLGIRRGYRTGRTSSRRLAFRSSGRNAAPTRPPADRRGNDPRGVTDVTLMSEQSNDCGPGRDPGFFRALTSIFLEHPDAASRYAIARANHLIDPRGGDGSRTGVLKDVEGELSLEFVAKPEQPDPGSSHCYLWEFDSETGTMRCAISYEKI